MTCDIAFTEVEVNAMNMLGLQYTLHCEVYNKDLFDEYPVVTYRHQTFPRTAGEAPRHEHAVFDDLKRFAQCPAPGVTVDEFEIGSSGSKVFRVSL